MSSSDQTPPLTFSEPAPATSNWKGAFASLAIGLAGAVFGLLPWIVTGMRLPLQNLWAVDVLPDQMPVAWLPFSQYSVTLVLAMMVVGSAAAGTAARALRDRLPRRAPLSIAAGVLFVQVVATAQAANVVAGGVMGSAGGALYLAACIGIAVVGILFGLLVLGLIARGPRAGAVIAFTLASIASGWWLTGLIAPLGSAGMLPDFAYTLLDAARWVPPVLVGVAIGWGGFRTPGRIVAAVGSLLLLWVVPALATAVSSAVGSRALLRNPLEVLDYGWTVFTSVLLMPIVALPPLVVAAVTAVIVATAGPACVDYWRMRRGTVPVDPGSALE